MTLEIYQVEGSLNKWHLILDKYKILYTNIQILLQLKDPEHQKLFENDLNITVSPCDKALSSEDNDNYI